MCISSKTISIASTTRRQLPIISPFFALIFLQFFSFGIFARRLGLYYDDWVLFDSAAAIGTGWLAVFSAMARGFWHRPGEIVIFAPLIKIVGLHTFVYQALILVLGIVEAWCLYLLAAALTDWPGLALLSAAMTAVYPNREVLHFWFGVIPENIAQILLLSSLLCHWHWTTGGRKKWLVASLSLYFTSVLCYESCAFMPLLLGGGLLVRRMLRGTSIGKAAIETARDLLPYAAPFLIATCLQWIILPRLIHAQNQKSVALGFSFGHLLKVYGAGFECVTNRAVHACFIGFVGAIREFSALRMLACVALTAVAAALLRIKDRPDRPSESIQIALGMAGTGFIGSYGPYALSGIYMPRLFGVMSRTNGSGAWIGGLLAASALAALDAWRPRGKETAGRWASRGFLALLLAAFTWTNWHTMLQWSRSWTVQQDILAKVNRKISGVPGPAAIFLMDYPQTIGTAIVFSAGYDFDAALRMASGRRDLTGYMWGITPIHFRKDDIVINPGSGKPIVYPYRDFYFDHYQNDRFERAGGPPSHIF